MDYIIKYLTAPMATGVFNCQCVVDVSGLVDFYKDIIEIFKKKKAPFRHIQLRISEISEIVKRLEEETTVWDEEVFDEIGHAIMEFVRVSDECPEEIKELFLRKVEVKTLRGTTRVVWRPRYYRRRIDVFKSCLLPDINDVLWVEKEEIDEKIWFFDVTSVKHGGLSIFKKIVQCIPHIGQKVNIKRERQTFSSRFTFRPYPLAVQLWLLSEEAETRIPKDLRAFLIGAVRYYTLKEWRTSIVLSAIAVESLLADLYEESHHNFAPSSPLGDLFRQVEDKVDFPQKIKEAIEMTNEARIFAVHRSHFPVSDREATNALFGATNFTMWYFSQFLK